MTSFLMDSKISAAFWSDAKIEPLGHEMKLAAIWLMTNDRLDCAGFCRPSARRFALDTSLPPEALASTIEALPETFERIGDLVWVRNYIRWQVGTGHTLAKNNMARAIAKAVRALASPPVALRVCAVYPALRGYILTDEDDKPLPSPYQGQERRGEERRGVEKEGAGGKTPDHQRADRARIDRIMRQPAGSAWAYLAEQHLGQLSPLAEEDLALVEWLYAQPASKDRPRLRSSPTSLLANWPDEVAKARRFATDRGAVVGAEKKEARAAEAPPEGWRDAVRAIIGDVPRDDFDRYPVDIRAQVIAHLAAKK